MATRFRLVILDDDAQLARVVAELASDLFQDLIIHTHTSLAQAQEALERLARAEDEGVIFLSDYHLPPSVETGLDFLDDVRARLPGAKRILMTGRDRSELEPALARAQLDAFLPKPFTILELQPLLTRLLDELRQARGRRVEVRQERELRTTNG